MEGIDLVFLLRRKIQKEGSGSLIVAHCSQRGVFTVRQQRCLAAVALCLHKCSLQWSELLEVMADSTGRLTERTHLLLNTHMHGSYGCTLGSSMRTMSIIHWKQHDLQRYSDLSLCHV